MVDVAQFGDRIYRSADFIPPIAHYPKHPFSNPLEDAQRNTYFHAQYHSRHIFSQSYGYDLKDVAGDQATVARSFRHTDYVGIARARKNVPEETTIIRAVMAVAVLSSSACTLYSRITIDNGGPTDVATSEQAIDAPETVDLDRLSANQQARARAAFPFSSGYAPVFHELAVALEDIDSAAPGRCRITVEAYATHDESGEGLHVQPMRISVFAEMTY